MTLRDAYDNALGTADDTARDAYDSAVELFLGGNYGAVEGFEAAIQADPRFALGHAGLARALMMEGRMPEARAAIETAQGLAPRTTSREQGHIAAMAALLAGQADRARGLTKAHMRDHPRDPMVAQLCCNVFGLIGFSGEVGREAELLAFSASLLPHYPESWWMKSMYAMALCETGQAEASLREMDQALALNPRNAQGAHFKAHALYELGDAALSRAFLAGWMAGYDPRSLLHGHISWHQALLALQDGDAEVLWAIIDAAVAPDSGTRSLPINTLTDTASILFRAEMAGLAVDPSRWQQISAYAHQYFPQTGQSFADLHAALGHAMAGDGDALGRIIGTARGFAGDLVRPLAAAWGHIARSEWRAALDDMTRIMATHERLGGSRAQRDLIDLAYVHVLLKLGLAQEARRALMLRRPVLAAAPPLAGYA